MACSFDRSSVEEYRSTHGKAPRGWGAWRFWLRRSGAYTSVEFRGNFGAAKVAALREARSLGCDTYGLQT